MKTRNAIFALAAITTAAIFAADMQGSWNTWLGWLSGLNSSGDRTTMQGAASGSESDDIRRTVLIGAGAGTYSTNVSDCVAVGYAALARTENMSNVVAIGSGAMYGQRNTRQATWINGQFFASTDSNRFWLKSNPNTPDTNAPIYYADGVLNLNATVRLNGDAISGGGGESGPVLLGYDTYVDPVNGDDLYSGATPGSAKRTIDAALLIPNTNICLMAGEHAEPINTEATVSRLFFCPYGKTRTTIRGRSANEYGFQPRYIENCTLADLSVSKNYYPAFSGNASNCVIGVRLNKTTCQGILSSVLMDCDVSCVWIRGGDQSYRGMLSDVAAYNTRFSFSSESNTTISVHSSDNSTFEDCVLIATNVGKFVYSASMIFRNCTVLCATATEWGSATSYNSIFGCGEGANIWQPGGTNNICGAYTNIAPLIGADYRPAVTNWRYRYTGYKSGPERAVRDSMLESIRAALEAAAN